MSIQPKKFIITSGANTAAYTYIYGYNIATQQYEALNYVTCGASTPKDITMNISTQNYYSKFKLVLVHKTSGFSADAKTTYREIRLISGTIRKG
jgi:hypothetical protein